MKEAGGTETCDADAPAVDRSLYYAMVAVDATGNVGPVSNVRRAYVPSPTAIERMGEAATAAVPYGADPHSHSTNPRREGTARGPGNKILLVIVAGIVCFVALCVILMLCIVVGYRKKKGLDTSSSSSNEGSLDSGKMDAVACVSDREKPSFDSTMRSMGVSTTSNGGIQSPGFSVCDDPDLVRETGRFLSAQPQQQVSFANEGSDGGSNGSHVYATATAYGWTELNNPYVVQSPNGGIYGQQQPQPNPQQPALPTYRDFQAQMMSSCSDGSGGSGYIANPSGNPTYARPLPRSQRPGAATAYSATSTLQHSTPQSQNSGSGSSSSGNTLQGMSSLFRSNNGMSTLAATISAGAGGSLSSGDERVPSVSPPAESTSQQGEQVRLIPPSLSNTPTKSILKKPKNNNNSAMNESLLASSRADERGSQSSGGGGGNKPKAAASITNRFSSSGSSSHSSNLSDRDTPTEGQISSAQPIASRLAQEESSAPDFSPSNTYLETSFDAEEAAAAAAAATNGGKVPPPTLPKPGRGAAGEDSSGALTIGAGTSTLERKIRNITQV
jgi:hypothetical protein